MSVEVKIPSLLQRHVGGAKLLKVKGSTVREIIEQIDEKYPGFKGRLIDEEGKLHPFITIYLNEEDIIFAQGLETEVKDGDVISILPAIAGGGEKLPCF